MVCLKNETHGKNSSGEGKEHISGSLISFLCESLVHHGLALYVKQAISLLHQEVGRAGHNFRQGEISDLMQQIL